MSLWLIGWIVLMIAGVLLLIGAADFEDFEINIGGRLGPISFLAIVAFVVGFQGIFAWLVLWMWG